MENIKRKYKKFKDAVLSVLCISSEGDLHLFKPDSID